MYIYIYLNQAILGECEKLSLEKKIKCIYKYVYILFFTGSILVYWGFIIQFFFPVRSNECCEFLSLLQIKLCCCERIKSLNFPWYLQKWVRSILSDFSMSAIKCGKSLKFMCFLCSVFCIRCDDSDVSFHFLRKWHGLLTYSDFTFSATPTTMIASVHCFCFFFGSVYVWKFVCSVSLIALHEFRVISMLQTCF